MANIQLLSQLRFLAETFDQDLLGITRVELDPIGRDLEDRVDRRLSNQRSKLKVSSPLLLAFSTLTSYLVLVGLSLLLALSRADVGFGLEQKYKVLSPRATIGERDQTLDHTATKIGSKVDQVANTRLRHN